METIIKGFLSTFFSVILVVIGAVFDCIVAGISGTELHGGGDGAHQCQSFFQGCHGGL